MQFIKTQNIKSPWIKERKQFEGIDKKSYNEIYNTRKWQRFSMNYRKRNPLCRECERRGIIKATALVDHIIPINQGGKIWDEENLQPLCHECHNKKSINQRWKR